MRRTRGATPYGGTVHLARIGLVTGLLAAATAVVIAALPADASDAPTAPYDAFTITSNSDDGTYNKDSGAVIFTPADPTFTVSSSNDSVVVVHGRNAQFDILIWMTAIVGQSWAVG